MNYSPEDINALLQIQISAMRDVTQRLGGLERIGDLPAHETCRGREHNPPSHYYYRDGVYRYTCPDCGATRTFTVRGPSW